MEDNILKKHHTNLRSHDQGTMPPLKLPEPQLIPVAGTVHPTEVPIGGPTCIMSPQEINNRSRNLGVTD